MDMSLSRGDVEAVAMRVVELLRETGLMNGQQVPTGPGVRLVDAAAVAEAFGVERDWVYAHAKELGAIRLGGKKGRLRFDLVALRERMESDRPAPATRRRTRPAGRRAARYNGEIARPTRKH
jgi:hypothetical protein